MPPEGRWIGRNFRRERVDLCHGYILRGRYSIGIALMISRILDLQYIYLRSKLSINDMVNRIKLDLKAEV